MEYRPVGTSTSAPGYELSRQVPPVSELRSNRTKSVRLFFFKRIAASKPENPVPIMMVSKHWASKYWVSKYAAAFFINDFLSAETLATEDPRL